jgi:NADPH:quinone reductase-like Zn-dependent oxidoreductase
VCCDFPGAAGEDADQSDVAADSDGGNGLAQRARSSHLNVGSRKHQMDFVRAIDAAGIKPVVDRSFDLDEIADAFRDEASGQHFGKICLEF